MIQQQRRSSLGPIEGSSFCVSTNLTTFALLQASTTNQEIDNRLTNVLAATIYSSH